MRYWQKIFLTTFILFVILLYVGVYMVVTMTYETALQTEREKCFIEHTNIALQMKDALSKWSDTPYDATESVYEDYFGIYNARGIALVLRTNEGEIISIGPDKKELMDLQMRSNAGTQATVYKLKDKKVVAVQSVLESGAYNLITIHQAEEFFQAHQNLKMKLLGGAVVYSVVLTLLLLLILPRLNMPLQNTADAAKTIAKGEYDARIPVQGYGELRELAESFNLMAQRVETQIRRLERETTNKQRFIDNLAHEMRTPLTAITGYAQYLELAELPEESKQEALDFIQAQSLRLLDVSEKLLVVAKLQNKPMDKKDINIKEMLELVAQTIRVQHSGVEIDLQMDEMLTWYTDETLLYVLAQNIIQNAAHACAEGEGKIVVVAGKTYITITDNGYGIAKKDLPHIFEPFFRADKSRARSNGSNGLGLEISSKIATYLNMKISVASEVGKGTSVTIIRLHSDSDEDKKR